MPVPTQQETKPGAVAKPKPTCHHLLTGVKRVLRGLVDGEVMVVRIRVCRRCHEELPTVEKFDPEAIHVFRDLDNVRNHFA